MKWYSYFNKKGENNLVDSENIEKDNLLVCQQLQYRRYTKFKNFAEFSLFFRECPEEEKCFYEMMRQEDGRKPYFDIDLDDMELDYKDMIKEIKKVIFDMLGKDIRFMVFDSSTAEKRSFHIIIDKVYLQSYKELEVFFDRVRNQISEKYQKYLDKSVYKVVQQFRMYKSHKYMKWNIKNFSKELSYNFTFPRNVRKEMAKFNFILASSLVTNIEGCKVLSGFQPVIAEPTSMGKGNASEGDIEDVMKLFYNKYSYGDFNFQECKEKNGNLLIVLRRLNPTFCKSCDRIHENENPFITVIGDFRTATFYCRRREEKYGDLLGVLGMPNFEEIRKLEPPIIGGEDTLIEDEEEIPGVPVEQENLEDVLEDIADTPKFNTPKRQKNPGKALDSLEFQPLVH